MLKKFLAVLAVLFVSISAYAREYHQSPSENFPYEFDYYYPCEPFSRSELNNALYDTCGQEQVNVDNGYYFVNKLQKTHCLVIRYSANEVPRYEELKNTLRNNIPTMKEFDRKMDEEFGRNYKFYLIFIDSNHCVLGEAEFKENIKAKRPWSFHDLNPFKND